MVAERGVITYPRPPFSDMPIEAQFYLPDQFYISAITLGKTTTVTTSVDHDYVVGQQIRFLIPASFGTIQLNRKTGYVISIPSVTQVEIAIDSSKYDPFILSTSKTQQAQILAIGDINTGPTNFFGRINQITYINGSFRNISP